MVKIPNLNDLKKMGSEWVETAKSSIENVGQTINKKTDDSTAQDGNPIRQQFRELYAMLNELKQIEARQMELTRKVEAQITSLAKVFEGQTKSQNPTGTKE